MEQTITFNAGRKIKMKEILNSRWEDYSGDIKKSRKIISADTDNNITLKIKPLSGRLFDVTL